MRVDTHLAVRRTAQRRTCTDCGKKSWGPRSLRNRAACPGTPGRANRTGAVGGEGQAAAAGQAAGGSATGTKALSGYSPSRQKRGNRHRGAERYTNTSMKELVWGKYIKGWFHTAAQSEEPAFRPTSALHQKNIYLNNTNNTALEQWEYWGSRFLLKENATSSIKAPQSHNKTWLCAHTWFSYDKQCKVLIIYSSFSLAYWLYDIHTHIYWTMKCVVSGKAMWAASCLNWETWISIGRAAS